MRQEPPRREAGVQAGMEHARLNVNMGVDDMFYLCILTVHERFPVPHCPVKSGVMRNAAPLFAALKRVAKLFLHRYSYITAMVDSGRRNRSF
jgi:hypothetical protein